MLGTHINKPEKEMSKKVYQYRNKVFTISLPELIKCSTKECTITITTDPRNAGQCQRCRNGSSPEKLFDSKEGIKSRQEVIGGSITPFEKIERDYQGRASWHG